MNARSLPSHSVPFAAVPSRSFRCADSSLTARLLRTFVRHEGSGFPVRQLLGHNQTRQQYFNGYTLFALPSGPTDGVHFWAWK